MMLQVITTCVFYIQKCFNFRKLLNYNMYSLNIISLMQKL